jgi:hypothetical protein
MAFAPTRGVGAFVAINTFDFGAAQKNGGSRERPDCGPGGAIVGRWLASARTAHAENPGDAQPPGLIVARL